MPYKDEEKNRICRRLNYWKNERDGCPVCGNMKYKRRNMCRTCFLKKLHADKEHYVRAGLKLRGRPSWNKGLTKEYSLSVKMIGDKKLNENNSQWVGDDVGSTALHNWVRRRKIKPKNCELCGKNKPSDLANMSGKYKRDVDDFKWLCRKCHMISDGRSEKLRMRMIVQNKRGKAYEVSKSANIMEA